MIRSRIAWAALLTALVLALVAVFGLSRPAAQVDAPDEQTPATLERKPRVPASALARLERRAERVASLRGYGARG